MLSGGHLACYVSGMVFPSAHRAWCIAASAAALLYLVAGIFLGSRPFDDTFISYRYAANVAHGDGLVFNKGEHVLGTTTPLWAFVLAALSKLGLPIPPTAFFVSLLFGPVIGCLIFNLLRRLDHGIPVAALSAILFFGLFDFLSLARSGMETSLFTCLVLATLYTGLTRRWMLAGLGAFLSCITRPEGVLLLAALGAQFAVGRSSNGSTDGRRAMLGLLAFAVPAAAWLAWTSHYYGSIIPQTIRAKAHYTTLDPKLVKFSWMNVRLFLFKGQYGGFIFQNTWLSMSFLLNLLAATGVVKLLWHARTERARGVLSFMTLAFFPLAFAGGLSITHAFTFFPWYYGPLYPFLALLAVLGANWLWSLSTRTVDTRGLSIWRVSTRTRAPISAGGALALQIKTPWIDTWRGGSVAVGLLVCAQLLAALLIKLPADRAYFWLRGLDSSVQPVPRTPNLTLATTEIGVIGWERLSARILDISGLVTPAALLQTKAVYLRSTRPDYVLLRTDNAADYLADLARDPWFATNYELISSVQDPYSPRAFQTFHRRDL